MKRGMPPLSGESHTKSRFLGQWFCSVPCEVRRLPFVTGSWPPHAVQGLLPREGAAEVTDSLG